MLEYFEPEEVADLLRAVAPACKEPDEWGKHLSTAMWKFGITNHRTFVAPFIAQLMVESSELNRVAENLDYRADRLMVVWPSRFPTIDIAQRYAHNPRELAIYVYGGRLGNKSAPSTDGWDFRGRGPIQTTGRANYEKLERELGIPITRKPELLEEKPVGALAAAFYWWSHRLSFLAADLPDDDQAEDFVTITRKINGGTQGLARRREYLFKACTHLGIPLDEYR